MTSTTALVLLLIVIGAICLFKIVTCLIIIFRGIDDDPFDLDDEEEVNP